MPVQPPRLVHQISLLSSPSEEQREWMAHLKKAAGKAGWRYFCWTEDALEETFGGEPFWETVKKLMAERKDRYMEEVLAFFTELNVLYRAGGLFLSRDIELRTPFFPELPSAAPLHLAKGVWRKASPDNFLLVRDKAALEPVVRKATRELERLFFRRDGTLSPQKIKLYKGGSGTLDVYTDLLFRAQLIGSPLVAISQQQTGGFFLHPSYLSISYDTHASPAIRTRKIECDAVIMCVSCCGRGLSRCQTEAIRRKGWVEHYFETCPASMKACLLVGRGQKPSDPLVVQLDSRDGYYDLCEKVQKGMRHMLKTYDFRWLCKCDTDSYVNFSKLRTFLQRLPEGTHAAGLKTFCTWEPDYEHLLPGGLYAISRELAYMFAYDKRPFPHWAEDLLVTERAKHYGVTWDSVVNMAGQLNIPSFKQWMLDYILASEGTNDMIIYHPYNLWGARKEKK